MAISRWGDLKVRLASALVLGVVALACLIIGDWAWRLLLAAGSVVLALEWAGLTGGRGRVLLIGGVAVVWALAAFGWFGLALAVAFALGGGELLLWGGKKMAAGLVYIGVATVALLWLRERPDGFVDMLLLLLIVWASDIGAYIAGRAIGGAKLAPAISPGKTRSGAIGGLVAACLIGVVAALWFGQPAAAFVLLAGALSALSQAGDLFESWLKRQAGAKDSGRLIPGHGGLFDRVDGLVAAAPAAAALAFALGRGVVLGS